MAISSSCGALDNIVVDTIDTAQRCVTFLKEQNIGVATFIGLDKVKIIRADITDLVCLSFFIYKIYVYLHAHGFSKFLFVLHSQDESVGEEHGSHSHSREQPSSF